LTAVPSTAMAQRVRALQKRSAGGKGGGGGGQPAPESLAAKDKRDSFELQYQEALTLFCNGKRVDAFELWKLLHENPLALHDTQRKVAVSLGQCYATGNGTAKDTLKAVEVFKKAVRLNSAQAGLELGRCLRYQLCDDENSSQHASAAVRAFADAARLGSVEAEYELGMCYLQVSEATTLRKMPAAPAHQSKGGCVVSARAQRSRVCARVHHHYDVALACLHARTHACTFFVAGCRQHADRCQGGAAALPEGRGRRQRGRAVLSGQLARG
jgi:hypothetical protein